MANLKNELPVAVHVASGGDARVRTGGEMIRLDGVSSGSFQVTNGTRYRLQFSARSMSGMVLLVCYTSPAALGSASRIVTDLSEITDDVPDGTTVYFATINPDDMTPMLGGNCDCVLVSYYG